jgi:arsenate reductase-like glutaredoxin family protein
MNKFKLLFDILLAKCDTLNEYLLSDEVKRALKAHLINYIDIPKKPTAGRLTPLLSIDSTSANANVAQSSNKKRKRNKKKEQSDKDERKSSLLEKPECPHCGKRHGGIY